MGKCFLICNRVDSCDKIYIAEKRVEFHANTKGTGDSRSDAFFRAGYYLVISVQPLANVVANYTCYNRDQESE